MDNSKQPKFLDGETYEEIAEGNNIIARFMPNMRWHVPTNTEYPPYWREFDVDGFVRKDYTAGRVKAGPQERFITLDYHNNWNRLKPVIDRIHTYSLVYPEQTEPIRKMSIVVDIIPAWRACVKFADFIKQQKSV